MKEILQTNKLNLTQPVVRAFINLAFFHIENVARVEQAVDVEETEEVYEE